MYMALAHGGADCRKSSVVVRISPDEDMRIPADA